MKYALLSAALAVALAAPCAARADDQEDARALVERAIEAAGGRAKLEGLTSGSWRTRATNLEVDPPRVASAQLHGQLPDKFRVESTSEVDGKKVTVARVIDGARGWTVRDGEVKEMDAEALKRSRQAYYHKQLAQTLVPLLRDRTFRLKLLGETKVGDRAALGLRVSSAGQPDVTLYFDKMTALVVKSELTDVNEITGKGEAVEMLFSKHRAFDGIMMPGRTETRKDGKTIRQIELLDFEPNAKVKPELFKKP
jgi:hypothetical protein